jgi:putative transposase
MKGKRYTTEEKIRIQREADRGEKSVADICREENPSEVSFPRWKRQFGHMEVKEARRLKELERENRELKQMLADSLSKNRVLEAVCKKNCKPSSSVGRRRTGGGGGDVFRASRLSVSGLGAFDVPLSRAAADVCGRTVKATAAGAVRGTSALWVSADRGVAAAGRLAGGQTAHTAIASSGRGVEDARNATASNSVRFTISRCRISCHRGLRAAMLVFHCDVTALASDGSAGELTRITAIQVRALPGSRTPCRWCWKPTKATKYCRCAFRRLACGSATPSRHGG